MKKKNFYPFFISFILLVAVIIVNRSSFNSMRDFTASSDLSRDVIISLERLSNHLKSAQIFTITYSISSGKDFYTLYRKEADSIPGEIAKLRSLIIEKDQKKRLNEIDSLINDQLPALMQFNIAELIARGEAWRLQKLFALHEKIIETINREKELLQFRKRQLEKSTENSSAFTIVFSIIAILLSLGTFTSNLLLFRKGKKLEGFLESILNTSQNGIVSYKAVRDKGKIIDFKIEFANAAIKNHLNIDPADVIGKRLTHINSYVEKSELFQRYIEVVESGVQQEFETVYKRENLEAPFFVLLAKLGDGVTATFHNLSSIKRYETALKENISQLELSNRELEQYAYVASHDLQEPLRKIMVYGNILQTTQSFQHDKIAQSHLAKIMGASERMQNLIKDILNFSSVKRESAFTQVNLAEACKNAVEDLDLLIAQKKAQIEIGELPMVEAISLQMNQLFYNLVNNSLKFSRENTKPVIEISAKPLSHTEKENHPALNMELEYCKITFRDNGIGFNQQYAEQIFGVFKRLNDRKNFPGSGIGLALCRKVVTNHHGEIYAESKEGEGATFYILLPLKQPDNKD